MDKSFWLAEQLCLFKHLSVSACFLSYRNHMLFIKKHSRKKNSKRRKLKFCLCFPFSSIAIKEPTTLTPPNHHPCATKIPSHYTPEPHPISLWNLLPIKDKTLELLLLNTPLAWCQSNLSTIIPYAGRIHLIPWCFLGLLEDLLHISF